MDASFVVSSTDSLAMRANIRLSFDRALCTVRYVGEVQGTNGSWLGVEWDDPSRGKHSGEYGGVKYFQCKSKSPTAGSFVRPGRPVDKPRSFLEALHGKYVDPNVVDPPSGHGASKASAADQPIEISGKIVEEVGFEKIRKQLAALQELKIVILDGMRIRGVLVEDQGDTLRSEELQNIKETCPKIIELDLSRNLLQDWKEVADICEQLDELRCLKLNGNRFASIDSETLLRGVSELFLEGTLLTWDEMSKLSHQVPNLSKLSLSSNQLSCISTPISNTITELSLESNDFDSLQSLSHLASLSQLNRLSLRRNNIKNFYDNKGDTPIQFSPTLTTLDISFNLIDSWSSIDNLPLIFPGLLNLRVSDNPLYERPPTPKNITGQTQRSMTIDEAYMLTLARLPHLQTLNYSKIAPQDRTNGELYYLSLIRKELSALPASEEKQIILSHPRYMSLCEVYGTPEIIRTESDGSAHPNSLAAKLVTFTFYRKDDSTFTLADENDKIRSIQTPVELKKEIPRTFDIYRIKAIVARHFSLPPLGFRLIWETEEWDPVETGTAEEDEWDSSDEGDSKSVKEGAIKRFVRREEEFVDSMRAVEHWLSHDTREVHVRIEMR
ncbi:hypothetical protein LOZ66_006602 [Ophidiomyces ophidiicola]|nr:hypothetical protein LOZ66_006602 [Ophidiomyces ophidiicola]